VSDVFARTLDDSVIKSGPQPIVRVNLPPQVNRPGQALSAATPHSRPQSPVDAPFWNPPEQPSSNSPFWNPPERSSSNPSFLNHLQPLSQYTASSRPQRSRSYTPQRKKKTYQHYPPSPPGLSRSSQPQLNETSPVSGGPAPHDNRCLGCYVWSKDCIQLENGRRILTPSGLPWCVQCRRNGTLRCFPVSDQDRARLNSRCLPCVADHATGYDCGDRPCRRCNQRNTTKWCR
jgi:hypothetical protein